MTFSELAPWLTIFVTVVITVVSPIIQTYLNNKHALRLLRFEEQKKNKDALKNYLVAFSKIDDPDFRRSHSAVLECLTAFFNAYPVAPKASKPVMIEQLENLRHSSITDNDLFNLVETLTDMNRDTQPEKQEP